MSTLKVHLIILGATLVVFIIAGFDAFLGVVVDYVIVVFLIVVAVHIVLSCGQ